MSVENNNSLESWEGQIDASVIDRDGNLLLPNVHALIGDTEYLPGAVSNDDEMYIGVHTRRIRFSYIPDFPFKEFTAAMVLSGLVFTSCHPTKHKEQPVHSRTGVVNSCSVATPKC